MDCVTIFWLAARISEPRYRFFVLFGWVASRRATAFNWVIPGFCNSLSTFLLLRSTASQTWFSVTKGLFRKRNSNRSGVLLLHSSACSVEEIFEACCSCKMFCSVIFNSKLDVGKKKTGTPPSEPVFLWKFAFTAVRLRVLSGVALQRPIWREVRPAS